MPRRRSRGHGPSPRRQPDSRISVSPKSLATRRNRASSVLSATRIAAGTRPIWDLPKHGTTSLSYSRSRRSSQTRGHQLRELVRDHPSTADESDKCARAWLQPSGDWIRTYHQQHWFERAHSGSGERPRQDSNLRTRLRRAFAFWSPSSFDLRVPRRVDATLPVCSVAVP
jgi:hypothetical protein